MAQNPSMAPSADEVYVHEHCKVLPGLPIVLDTPGLVEEEQEEADEDGAMAEAEQIDELREAGEEH